MKINTPPSANILNIRQNIVVLPVDKITTIHDSVGLCFMTLNSKGCDFPFLLRYIY